MAAPEFQKTGVTTVTFSVANVFPSFTARIPNQFIGVSDDNTVRVASIGSPREIINLEFRQLTRDDRDNILAFLANSKVNYGQNSFTFVDANGDSHTVQLLEGEISLPEISDDNVSWSINLTVV